MCGTNASPDYDDRPEVVRARIAAENAAAEEKARKQAEAAARLPALEAEEARTKAASDAAFRRLSQCWTEHDSYGECQAQNSEYERLFDEHYEAHVAAGAARVEAGH